MIFAAASYTDHLDGKIARSRNLVTTFGKFMDPLADKIMVISALVCFVSQGPVSYTHLDVYKRPQVEFQLMEYFFCNPTTALDRGDILKHRCV